MSWAMSSAAIAQLRTSHTAAGRVDVLHSGRPVYALDVVRGRVTADAGRPILRNLSCTLVDPTGALSGGDVDDLLNPYDCEIAPSRGVQLPAPPGALRSSTEELAPLGVFGLTARQVSGDGSIAVAGQDRAMSYQGPMTSALAIAGGTPIEEAVVRLLSTRNPGLSLLTMRTGFTCGPLLFAPDVDVWREAQNLAESVGGRLFHDRLGQCTFAMSGPTSRVPGFSWTEGDGLLLDVDRQEDSDTIRNVVIAESPDGRIRAVVEDTDPSSPTYARGRFGRRPVTMVNQHFGSVEQAQQAAAARLAYELGRSETVTFAIVPFPGLDTDEIAGVHFPAAGLNRRGLVVASCDIPLTADEEMTVGCRKSVLAPDGTIFDTFEVIAA